MKNIGIFLFVLSFFSISSYGFTLQDGFKLALENDMDTRVSKNNLLNIKQDINIANSLLLPKVDFSATVETSKLTEKKLTPGDDSHSQNDEYELKVTQPIFDGFESQHEKDLQSNRFNSAKYDLLNIQSKLALDYTQSYINTLREKDLLNLNIESLVISENIFNKIYKKVDAGYGTKLEFDESKGNLAEKKVNLSIQKIKFKEAIENLKLYVQTDFDTNELIKPSFYSKLPNTLSQSLKMAMNNNPAINVSKANLKVAMSEEKKAKKDFYPNVNFTSSYKVNDVIHSGDNEEYNQYKLGFELNYNLYNGGKDSAKHKKAFQNIKEKQFLIKKSEYQIKSKLRLSWNSYKLNKEKQDSLKQYLIVKKDILDSSIKEFDLGLKDLNSLLEVHIDYIDVKKDLISNSYDLLFSKYRVLGSIGHLQSNLTNSLPTLNTLKSSKIVKNLFSDTSYSFNSDKDLDNKELIYASNLNKKTEVFFNNEIKVKKVSYKNFELTSNKSHSSSNSSFQDKFLNAPKNKYTINLALSTSEYQAKRFLQKHNILNESFSFSFGYKKPFQKIMYGIYNTKKDAKLALSRLSKSLKRNMPRVEKIFIKQNLYSKYNGTGGNFFNHKTIVDNSKKNMIRKVSYSIPKISKNKNSLKYTNFKDKFLNASKNKYTINLAFSDSTKKAQRFLDRYNLSDNGFYFMYKGSKEYQRIMYGIFNTRTEALKVLNNFPSLLKKNKPIIEKINRKQKVYHKYNAYVRPINILRSI